jgi:lipid A 3-O-deacylase
LPARISGCAFLVVAALWWATPVRAVDAMAVELGRGEGISLVRLGVQWDWKRRLLQGAEWHLGGYWDLAAGRWWNNSVRPGQNDGLWDVGLTPVFRVQPNGLVGPYLEAAIGAHLLSARSLGDKRFGTRFQFGDHLGIGYRFGAKQHFDLGYRFQHLSNAGIRRPNPGVNFHQMRLQYRF